MKLENLAIGKEFNSSGLYPAPSKKQLDELKESDFVLLTDLYERYWVRVTQVNGNEAFGIVCNFWRDINYNFANTIEFKKENIIKIVSDVDCLEEVFLKNNVRFLNIPWGTTPIYAKDLIERQGLKLKFAKYHPEIFSQEYKGETLLGRKLKNLSFQFYQNRFFEINASLHSENDITVEDLKDVKNRLLAKVSNKNITEDHSRDDSISIQGDGVIIDIFSYRHLSGEPSREVNLYFFNAEIFPFNL